MTEPPNESRIRRLIEASSLGTPEARRLRATVPDETARRIVEHSHQDDTKTRWVLHCPVDNCGWEHERTNPNLFLHLVRLADNGRGLDFGKAFAAASEVDDVECRRHLAEHPVEDFLRTISHLRAQLAGFSAAAAGQTQQ